MPRVFAWLLNAVYLATLIVALPWLLWSAWRHGKYRAGFGAKLLGRIPVRTGTGPCVWLHAVSVGEVNLLATTLRELGARRPDWKLVISTTTLTGFTLAQKKYPEHTVFYCPLDFSWAVNTALARVRPELLVLAELELWPNLIAAAKRRGTRIAIINGRLSDRSFRGYRRIRPLVAHSLAQLDLIAAQNAETAERFIALGTPAAVVHNTGSLKFDGAVADRKNPRTRQMRELAGFTDDDVVFLAGSTQEPEERIALEVYRQLMGDFPQLRLVLVPRHPERFDEVARLLDESNLAWQRRSELTQSPAPVPQPPILLVDSVGELGAWWGTAHMGFVGGSFGTRGGQNMLEPAAYGVATCFGPNTWNFRDIVAQLLATDAAVVVQNTQELGEFVRRALRDPAWAAALGERARQLVLAQQGATVRTVESLLPLVEKPRLQSEAA